MNSKTELFLDKYKKLEAVVSARYNLSNSDSAVVFLERRAEYRTIKSELAYCREVRNLLTHNPKVGERYAVEPSDEMIALLDKVLERVKNPRKAKHIWVPKSRVLCRTLKDPVRPAMWLLYRHNRPMSRIPKPEDGVSVKFFFFLYSNRQDGKPSCLESLLLFRNICQGFLQILFPDESTFVFLPAKGLAQTQTQLPQL